MNRIRNIHYEIQGEGHPVICLAGALGTGKSDFGPQLAGLSSKFTMIAPDPLGYGASRPPARDFDDFILKDAENAAALMERLDYKKYSVIGWSDGANSAIALAAIAPECVERIVVFGGNSFVDERDLTMYRATADTSKWSPAMRNALGEIYGDQLQPMWNAWLESMEDIFHNKGGNICEDLLKHVRCPALVMHGDKDPMVPSHHPIRIAGGLNESNGENNVHLVCFPDGKHNIHIKYASVFNKLCAQFLQGQELEIPAGGPC